MKTYTEQDLIKLVNMIDNEYRQYTRNAPSIADGGALYH